MRRYERCPVKLDDIDLVSFVRPLMASLVPHIEGPIGTYVPRSPLVMDELMAVSSLREVRYPLAL